jgi:hypothetical protein
MSVPYPRIEPLSGNFYRLLEDYVYHWEKEGVRYRLVVPAGFTCDLASIPRLLWWYISPFDLGSAAVPHDWLYAHGGRVPSGSHSVMENGVWQEVGQPWTRKDADRLFGRMMREAGVHPAKRKRAYRAVRLFGAGAWKSV